MRRRRRTACTAQRTAASTRSRAPLVSDRSGLNWRASRILTSLDRGSLVRSSVGLADLALRASEGDAIPGSAARLAPVVGGTRSVRPAPAGMRDRRSGAVRRGPDGLRCALRATGCYLPGCESASRTRRSDEARAWLRRSGCAASPRGRARARRSGPSSSPRARPRASRPRRARTCGRGGASPRRRGRGGRGGRACRGSPSRRRRCRRRRAARCGGRSR